MFCPGFAFWRLVLFSVLQSSILDRQLPCWVSVHSTVWVPVLCVSVPRCHELVCQGRTCVHVNEHVT